MSVVERTFRALVFANMAHGQSDQLAQSTQDRNKLTKLVQLCLQGH